MEEVETTRETSLGPIEVWILNELTSTKSDLLRGRMTMESSGGLLSVDHG